MRLLFIFLVSLSFGQCSSSKKNLTKTENAVVEEEMQDTNEEKVDDSLADDCYPGKKQLKQIRNQEATIVTVIGRKMLVFDYTRLDPCKLPEEFAKDDLKVMVSGATYETDPNVRVAGQPFVISTINLVE